MCLLMEWIVLGELVRRGAYVSTTHAIVQELKIDHISIRQDRSHLAGVHTPELSVSTFLKYIQSIVKTSPLLKYIDGKNTRMCIELFKISIPSGICAAKMLARQ